MKWVTKNYVHLDRVACPWLIRRFVDTSAEFEFVAWDRQKDLPPAAIPFAIAGAELGPHDQAGPTFQKILDKYKLQDAALRRIGRVITAGANFRAHALMEAKGLKAPTSTGRGPADKTDFLRALLKDAPRP